MSRMLALGLALVVAAVVLGGVASTPARAASVTVNLYGSAASGWGTTATSESNPGPTITVNQGDTVTVTLHSSDGFAHQFLLDYNGNGAADSGEPASGQFTSTATVTFVASQAGSFPYLCLLHASLMKGTFVVQSTGGTVSSTPGWTVPLLGGAVAVAAVAGIAILLLRRKH